MAHSSPFLPFLRQETPGGKPTGETAEQDTAETASESGLPIRCRACGLRITSESQRIEVSGAHRHTFANPHGIVFEIGCFQSAWGCAPAGLSSDEFTWFRGYRWRIVVCRGCVTHLGWHFADPGASSFYGLILDRLAADN